MRLRSEFQEQYPIITGGTEARSMATRSGNGARAHPRYHNTSDQAFLGAVKNIVQEHLADPTFDTAEAAQEMAMSRMHLHRKLRALTGCSTRQYITARRMEEACMLLGQPSVRVCDVAEQVGFRSPSYFARAFSRVYGLYPSEFARRSGARPATVREAADA